MVLIVEYIRHQRFHWVVAACWNLTSVLCSPQTLSRFSLPHHRQLDSLFFQHHWRENSFRRGQSLFPQLFRSHLTFTGHKSFQCPHQLLLLLHVACWPPWSFRALTLLLQPEVVTSYSEVSHFFWWRHYTLTPSLLLLLPEMCRLLSWSRILKMSKLLLLKMGNRKHLFILVFFFREHEYWALRCTDSTRTIFRCAF